MSRAGVRSTMVHSGEFSRRLGMPTHHVQVMVVGSSQSAADFARRLIEFGVAYGSEGSVARNLREWGGSETTENAVDVADAERWPGALIVRPLDDYTRNGKRLVITAKGAVDLVDPDDFVNPHEAAKRLRKATEGLPRLHGHSSALVDVVDLLAVLDYLGGEQ